MTVKELRQMLKDYEPDQEVYIAFGSGDYWRTVVATPIDDLDEAWLVPSPYHQGIDHRVMKIMSEDDGETDLPDVLPVVLYSGRIP